MEITFLENGIDSLQKGFNAFLDFEKETVSKAPDKADYLTLKEAVLSTQHGIEILIKYILFQKSEFLIVDKIDDLYIQALSEKEKQNRRSVFDTQFSDNVHTITFKEALNRVKQLSQVALPKDLEDKLRRLEKYRNMLTHAEVYITDRDILSLFPSLWNELDLFFFKCIGDDYKTLSGYDQLQKNYNEYMHVLEEKGLETKKKTIDVFSKAIEVSSISIGEYEVKRIEDFRKAARFFTYLYEQDVEFGMDMYNGWCSGEASIKPSDESHFCIVCPDNDGEYYFRFKSLILVFLGMTDASSPLLFFESEQDDKPLSALPAETRESFRDDEYIESYFFPEDNRETYDYSEICAIERREDEDENYIAPDYVIRNRFLLGRVIAACNVKGLLYPNFHAYLKMAENMDGHQFEIALRESINLHIRRREA